MKSINRIFTVALWSCTFLLIFSCQMKENNRDTNTIVKSDFGQIDGENVYLFTLNNSLGTTMKVTNYGGIVTSLTTIDRNGNYKDILLGFDSLSKYLDGHPYFGALIGRYGNRIDSGKFTLDGIEYQLATNNDPNHLHGGVKGFDKVLWEAEELVQDDRVGLKLTYVSRAGEEGYPGTLIVQVTYFLTDENAWEISYRAETDATTVLNLTQHSYFNLGNTQNILDHELLILGEYYLPVDETLIPMGNLESVYNSPFDFTSMHAIGDEIDTENDQLKIGGGYDHCWTFEMDNQFKKVAELYDPGTGRVMEVLTTEPGLQFYSSNFLDGSIIGKNNQIYGKRYGLCLETQHFPDSPNQSGFPTTELHPGEVFTSKTVYKFSIR